MGHRLLLLVICTCIPAAVYGAPPKAQKIITVPPLFTPLFEVGRHWLYRSEKTVDVHDEEGSQETQWSVKRTCRIAKVLLLPGAQMAVFMCRKQRKKPGKWRPRAYFVTDGYGLWIRNRRPTRKRLRTLLKTRHYLLATPSAYDKKWKRGEGEICERSLNQVKTPLAGGAQVPTWCRSYQCTQNMGYGEGRTRCLSAQSGLVLMSKKLGDQPGELTSRLIKTWRVFAATKPKTAKEKL